jgi:polysaccharide export outer membrane protein
VAGVLVTGMLAARAQTPSTSKVSPTVPAPSQPADTIRSYIIGPQDQLSITVYDEPDLTNKYRVDDQGMVAFPLISRIQAAGKTISQFQDELRAMLANGYLRNPQVSVDIDQFKSQSVFVIGEVRSPGKISMTGPTMTLLEALAQAGSPTAVASDQIIVVHPRKPNSRAAVPAADAGHDGEEVRVNRRDLELGKAQDVLLRDGDIINVPPAQRFFISGQVRNPGTFVLNPGMTVEQAIAVAGGLTDRGSERGLTATRLVNGRSIEVALKLSDLVQANDTINIRQRFF